MNIVTNFTATFAALLFSLGFTSVCSADVVWSEDFESATPFDPSNSTGDTLQTLGAPWAGGGRGSYWVSDSALPFGAGNQSVQLRSFGDPWTFTDNNQTSTPVATLSFDLFNPSTLNNDGWLRVRLGGTENLDIFHPNFDPEINNSLSVDTVHHFDIVSNDSGSPLTYNGVTLATGQMDIWVDGVLVHTVAGGTNDGFNVWINEGQTDDDPAESIFMDNFAYHNMAFVQAVPEPSSLVLLGLVSIGLLNRRRR